MGLELRPDGDLRDRRSRRALSCREPRAAQRPPYAAGLRDRLLRHRGALRLPLRAGGAVAAVLVRRQNRIPALHFYLGARHAAPLPLRPAHGIRLEIPLPGGGAESARHRLRGGLVPLIWTSSSSWS